MAVPITKILLVEDIEADIVGATRILNKFPVALEVARDGFAAQHILFDGPPIDGRTMGELPQIVLLDLSLPGMHGLDVLRKIKSDQRTSQVVVVILTANQEEKAAMDCYRLRCDGMLIKPLTPQNVTDLLAKFGLKPIQE